LAQLSIVIPVYDNWWLTARCLSELDRLHRSGSVLFETIVVDNASTDETPRAIAAFPWVRYLRHETNRNFAGACNAGARMAEAPLVLFLNNDAYPLGDAFAPMVRTFDRPEVVIVGGALFFEDGATQAAGLVVLPNAHWHYYWRNLGRMWDAVIQSRDALAVSGAAMAVRTSWFLENGGFDESYANGFEDVDLCLRAREQGRTIAYVANARFAHYEAASAGRFDHEATNERRFYERWSALMATLPRTARGSVGAIAVQSDSSENPLLAAARGDLEGALRSFGHPIVRGTVAPWHRFDRRFRQAATLSWFSSEFNEPAVSIYHPDDSMAMMKTYGEATVYARWLPCASAERVTKLGLRRSGDPSCTRIGIVGSDEDVASMWLSRRYPTLRITPQMLLGDGSAELACVLHLDLSDDSAFGNVLLAQAGLPAVVVETGGLRGLFPPDVALTIQRGSREGKIADAVTRFAGDVSVRERYGSLIAADSRRRFSPRRSAIRVVDLLCAARFGLERPVNRTQ
jgi:GT2 family glycosyltransferase